MRGADWGPNIPSGAAFRWRLSASGAATEAARNSLRVAMAGTVSPIATHRHVARSSPMSAPFGGRHTMLLMILRTVGVALLLYGLLVFVAQRRVAFPGTAREAPRSRTNVPA